MYLYHYLGCGKWCGVKEVYYRAEFLSPSYRIPLFSYSKKFFFFCPSLWCLCAAACVCIYLSLIYIIFLFSSPFYQYFFVFFPFSLLSFPAHHPTTHPAAHTRVWYVVSHTAPHHYISARGEALLVVTKYEPWHAEDLHQQSQ